MSLAAMKLNVLGAGPLGPAATFFQHAFRLVQADKNAPPSVVCPAALLLAPDAVARLLASGAEASLLAALAPLGTRKRSASFWPTPSLNSV